MEVFAKRSSITARIQISLSVSLIATDIINYLQCLPLDVQRLLRKLSILQSELELIKRLLDFPEHTDYDNIRYETVSIIKALRELRMSIRVLQISCDMYEPKKKHTDPEQVLRYQGLMQRLLKRLADAQASLNDILMLSNM